MKQRSTTPAFKGLTTKSVLVVVAVLMAISVPLATMQRVFADSYDDQIRALQQQADQAQTQANRKKQQADTLASKLQQLASQKHSIQVHIDLSQAQYDKLKRQIKETEEKIADNKDALGATMADLYVDGTISPLEMLASSKNIGDYVDKQTYQSSIRDTLTQTINTIQELQAKLEKDKKSVKVVLDKQTAQKNSLVAVENEKQVLLAKTKGEEAAYQQQVSSAQAKMADVSAQQRSFYQSLLSRGGGTSAGVAGSFQWNALSPSNGGLDCSGGYEYCGTPDSTVDPWGLYNRECVSYVAWALANRFHKYVGHFSGQGNAYEWPSSAPAYSGATRTYDPQPGDAVILPADGSFAPLGHAMIVESVGGGWVHVSQFNWFGNHGFSTMDIKETGVIFLRFPPA